MNTPMAVPGIMRVRTISAGKLKVKTRMAFKKISTPALSRNRARKAVASPKNLPGFLSLIASYGSFRFPPNKQASLSSRGGLAIAETGRFDNCLFAPDKVRLTRGRHFR